MITVLDIWRVKRWAVPIAFFYMAWHRRIRRHCSFAKLLGTGAGRTFTPSDADLFQWAILTVWDSQQEAEQWHKSGIARAWNRIAIEHATFMMRAISSHGTWSGKEPFDVGTQSDPRSLVAAITRARIKNSRARFFWRSVPPVTLALHSAPGLVAAVGIGEAPIGLQGTFSVWENSASLREFAYRDAAHAAVIERTKEVGWYAEELFARFEVVQARGHLQGKALDRAR